MWIRNRYTLTSCSSGSKCTTLHHNTPLRTKRHSSSSTSSSPSSSSPAQPLPLDGIRVVDMSRILAAPFGTMILGDYGAEIIKVEHPVMGDDTRHWGPPFTNNGAMSAYYACTNRNKKSICVDIKTEEGRNIIYQLVKNSDVFVENYLPGKLDSLGLGYGELSKINEKLIYCSITGYGPDGPYKNRPGVDVIVEALAGLMHITGDPDGNPAKAGVALTDICTGLYAHGAILSALLLRQKTNLGQKIDLSLLQTQIACLANVASNYLIGGLSHQRMGTSHPSIVPYQTFHTSDGHIMIGATNNHQFTKLMYHLDLLQAATDHRFSTNPLRVKHREILVSLIESKTKQKTTKEWEEALEDSGVSFGPVNDIRQTFDDPQVRHLDMVRDVYHPGYGWIKLSDAPVRWSGGAMGIRSPPPLLGEHTEEVLQGVLGYTMQKIEELRQLKIIK